LSFGFQSDGKSNVARSALFLRESETAVGLKPLPTTALKNASGALTENIVLEEK
jgi:hypothetical protein